MNILREKASEIFKKIKSIKHIEIIVAVIALALVMLLFGSFGSNKNVSETVVKETTITEDVITVWENKLSNVLSKIDGVGNVSVMITAKSTVEKITANTTTTAMSNNGSGQTTNTTTSPVIVNNNGSSEPYIIKEIMPEIMGVIVIAQGADDAVTKLSIMRAIQTVLDVDSTCVEIYPMK